MIEKIALASLFIWGIHCLFMDGYILYDVGIWIEKRVGTMICKPLFLCPPCMSSVWGIIIGGYFYGLSINIIPFIIALCGLNYILKTFIYPEYED